MITAVSLSPAIDKRLEFASFTTGQTNRVLSTQVEGAGKAVDVVLAAHAIGMATQCIGLLAGSGEAVSMRLAGMGIAHDFLAAPGIVRVNLKLYDRQTGETTEVNEPVPEAPEALLRQAENAAVAAAGRSAYLVLTGSLPTGCPQDWYARVICRVHKEAPACRCVLDAEGERFLLGTKARPWLVKPNLYELSLAAGRKLSSREDILAAARQLLVDGPSLAIVSLGGEGAIAVSSEAAYFAPALSVPILTTTGAGDAMVAGLLHGHATGESLDGMLRHGVASATARCAYAGERYVDGALFAAYLPQVQVSPMA